VAFVAAAFAGTAAVRATPTTVVLRSGKRELVVDFLEPNVVRVHDLPDGHSTPRTLVVDPRPRWPGAAVRVEESAHAVDLSTSAMQVKIARPTLRVEIDDSSGTMLLRESSDFSPGSLQFQYADAGPFYGIESTSVPGNNVDRRQDIRTGIYRDGGSLLAGHAGDGAAPLVFTTRYGLLIDSDGGTLSTTGGSLRFERGSRHDVEFFAIAGDPEAIMRAVADISGHPPMMPKWSLGFMNSQWDTTQAQVSRIVQEYRTRQIPIDAFILDYDWKAWGEDDYGEWRWNSTTGLGNVAPDKFPGGASGAFALQMLDAGVHLVGIAKPRVLLENAAGGLDQAARYALAHRFFFSWERPYIDVYSLRPALDVDFSKAAAREWFWQHFIPSYRAGMTALWNDEADATGWNDPADPHPAQPLHAPGFVLFPNFEFTNMERSYYEGVRAIGGNRLFSLNRNFYLGAQRYAYAEWSGDIGTGFDSMRDQAIRMLGTLDLGEPHWSMDAGGYEGNPRPENYARWMQFAAFVPIMRVHGTFGAQRQPWLYGAQAESDAKAAIELRYRLMPYMYSYEREAHDTGVGIVRPLIWEFPDDAAASLPTDEWMFGKALLVAPILGEGQAHRSVYLPTGTWFDYFRGARYDGPTTVAYPVDPNTWSDVPLFARSGSIIPTQDVQQYTSQFPVAHVYLDVFPSAAPASFVYYDDDGTTYDYEKGVYYSQRLSARRNGDVVRFDIAAPIGSFEPALRAYQVSLHGIAAQIVRVDGALSSDWKAQTDRFGPVTIVTVDARHAHSIEAK